MLLRAEGVSKSFGPKQVLKSVDLQFDKGEKLGLVGRNGSGKTTLLKILMGISKPDTGEIILCTDQISYLPQLPVLDAEATVGETIRTPDARQASILERISELEGLMAIVRKDADYNRLNEEYACLQDERQKTEIYRMDNIIKESFSKVGLSEDKITAKVAELSGGEKTKVFLARILTNVAGADILFLDEPTSHLDIDTVEWLEDYLGRLGKAVMIVSHDRYFLDRVVSRIFELDDGAVRSYSGNYSDFVEKKRMEIERMTIAKEKDRTERARQKKIAEELHRRAWFSSTHKTRLKMIERMETVEGPREEKEIRIGFGSTGKHGKNLVEARGLSVELGGNRIIDGIDFEMEAGDKLGIFGPNGSGKTTLLRAIISEIPSEGELWVAPGARIGYYAQGHDTLDEESSALEQLMNVLGPGDYAKARSLLARLLLAGKDVERPISTLSGGERARVALSLVIAEKRNLLVMDEPTNYLDIPSRHAVESALIQYPGSLLVVTHDRYFLDSVCNKVGLLKDGILDIHNCTYSQMKDVQEGRRGISVPEDEYVVVSGFKDWSTMKTYKPGDRLRIGNSDRARFKWALINGKVRRTSELEEKGTKK